MATGAGGGASIPAHQSKQKRRNRARARAGEGKGEYVVKEEKEKGLSWMPATIVADGGAARRRQAAKGAKAKEGESGGICFCECVFLQGKQGNLGF